VDAGNDLPVDLLPAHGLSWQYVAHLQYPHRPDDDAMDIGAFEINE
jgi:hypothetical protein